MIVLINEKVCMIVLSNVLRRLCGPQVCMPVFVGLFCHLIGLFWHFTDTSGRRVRNAMAQKQTHKPAGCSPGGRAAGGRGDKE